MDKGLIFKQGTSLWGVHPKIRQAIWEVRRVLNQSGYRCVVTSLWDGIHGENSFHHYGMAVDIRSNEIRSHPEKVEIRNRIKNRLGAEFDAILEAAGTGNEHFHIEWEAGRAIRETWITEVLLGSGSALSPAPANEPKSKPWYKRIF